MIIYTTCLKWDPVRAEADHVFTDHKDFLDVLRGWEGSVMLELQPGDVTKYDIALIRDGDKVVLASAMSHCWAVLLDARHPLTPYGLPPGVNPVTAVLCCDVYNVATDQDEFELLYPWADAAAGKTVRVMP